ncbi:MAG: MASE1 domain-containing protein [Anaerolineales bacterium]|nr:MASE1 domain-containing protein [Anaerolineales bacterium]
MRKSSKGNDPTTLPSVRTGIGPHGYRHLQLLLWLLVYVLSTQLDKALSVDAVDRYPLIWLPAGIALAGAIWFGWSILPWLVAGSFVVNAGYILTTDVAITPVQAVAICFALMTLDVSQMIFAYWLWQRFVDAGLATVQSYLKFVFIVCTIPYLITAFGYGLMLWLVTPALHAWDATRLAVLLVQLGTGDAVAVFMVVPLIWAWRRPDRRWGQTLIGVAFCMLLVLAASIWQETVAVNLLFLAMPMLMFLALVFGLQGITLGIFALGMWIVGVGAQQNIGPLQLEIDPWYVGMIGRLILVGIPMEAIAVLYEQLRKQQHTLEAEVALRTEGMARSQAAPAK